MKRFSVIICCCVFFLTGCATVDSKKMQNKIDVLESKVDSVQTRQDSIENQLSKKSQSVTYIAEEAGAPSKSSGNYTQSKTAGKGMSSKDIQRALRNAGYYDGAIDGKIGPKSKKAIKSFQQDHGLKVDGVVGAQTMQALNGYLSAVK
ncbi:MAG: peptidoglycan-binding domain-containing protein [Candidatus Omnitrophota bacterium]